MSRLRPDFKRAFFGFFLLILIQLTAMGDDEPDANIPSGVTLEFGGDTAKTQVVDLDFDLGLKTDQRLLLGVGSSRNKDDAAEAKTQSFRVGFETDPLESLQWGFYYENWGEKNELKTHSFKGKVIVNKRDWIYSLSPELRTINFKNIDAPFLRLRQFTTTNTGLTFNVTYFGIEKFRLDLAIAKYFYARPQEDFSKSAFINLVSIRSLTLTSGFLDSSFSLNTTYMADPWSIGLGYFLSRLYIDPQNVHTVALRIGRSLKSWRLGLGLGGGSPGASQKYRFASLSATYSW